jgi:hypothetical protein
MNTCRKTVDREGHASALAIAGVCPTTLGRRYMGASEAVLHTSGARYAAVVVRCTRSSRVAALLRSGTMSSVCALPKSQTTQWPLSDCRMFSPFKSLHNPCRRFHDLYSSHEIAVVDR